MTPRTTTITLTITIFLTITLPFTAAFSELKGRNLRGCVLIENPYVVKDVTRRTGFSGIAISYLERLQDNLEFTIDLERWNKSFTAFIEKMAVCIPNDPDPAVRCPCDIGVGSFTMTNARAEAIVFVWPFSNEAHAMVSRKSDLRVDDSQSAWFVFKTFTPSVWGIIGLGVFLHAVGTYFYGPFHDHSEEAARSFMDRSAHTAVSCKSVCLRIKNFVIAFLTAYSHLIGHPREEDPHDRGNLSFHRTAWLVLGVTTGLFLLTVYEASLTVLLFESTKESPFRTLGDITDCNLDPARVAMINGGASQKFWNTAVNTTENKARCGWGKVGFTVRDLEQGFQFVQDNKADLFYSLEGSVKFRANRNCEDFEQVGEPFFSTSVGFVMAKQADITLRDILSRETRILREQDAYESASLLAARNSCEDVVDATITSGRLAAFFIMYAVAWVFLVVYRIVFRWKFKNDKKRDMRTNSPRGNVEVDVRNITSVAPERYSEEQA